MAGARSAPPFGNGGNPFSNGKSASPRGIAAFQATLVVGDLEPEAVDPKRWRVLWLFCLQSCICQALWITFAPITAETATIFDVNDTWVNALSLVFMFLYPVGMVMVAHLMPARGLRAVVMAGAWLDVAGCVLRAGSVLLLRVERRLAFGVLLAGQSLAAVAQPCFTNAPARIAMDWFPAAERDVATVVSAMMMPVGNALGQALPPIAVAPDASRAAADAGMAWLLGAELAATALCALCAHCGFQAAPYRPPSRAAAQRRSSTRLEDSPGGSPRSAGGSVSMLDPYRALLQDGPFRVLMVAVGIGLGFFNAFITVLAQLIRPAGYTSDDAGLFGAVLLLAGMPAAGAVGLLLDRFRAYTPVLRSGATLCACAICGFFLLLRPQQQGLVCLGCALLGATLMPLLPVALEAAAETTYPVPEESSGGLLMLTGQVIGVVVTLVLNVLMPMTPTFEGVWTPASIFCVSTVALVAFLLCFWRAPYRRMAAESDGSAEFNDHGLGANNGHGLPSSLSRQMLMERGMSRD